MKTAQPCEPGAPTGSVLPYAGFLEPAGWLFCFGQAISRTDYAALFARVATSGVVTITIASPGVISWAGHPFKDGDPFSMTTTGALPTGFTAGNTYYAVNVVAGVSFRGSATPTGAGINTSGTQSGVHTALYAPFGRGNGTTTFTLPDLRGRAPYGRDDMGGSAAARINIDLIGKTLGVAGGNQAIILQEGQLPTHLHMVGLDTSASGGDGNAAARGSDSVDGSFPSEGVGSDQAHSNIAPLQILNYIIKT